MNQLLKETRLSFDEIARRWEVNLSTVYRWAKIGVDGIRLESMRIGAAKFSTEEAVLRFLGKLNGEELTLGPRVA